MEDCTTDERGLTENAGHEIAGQTSVRPTLH